MADRVIIKSNGETLTNDNGDDNNGFHQRSAAIVRRFRLLLGTGNRDGDENEFQHRLKMQIPIRPINFDALRDEEMLCGVINAFPHLRFSSLKLHVNALSVPNPNEFWCLLMENFEGAVEMGLEYVRQLPGINLIAPPDRRRIFSECLLPMAAVQQMLVQKAENQNSNVPGDLFFLNMTPQARALFVSYFPVYQALVKETFDIGVTIAKWAPSPAEIAFLEALLFYHFGAPGLENPDAVEHLRGRLLRAIEAHLQATCSEEKAGSVMEQLLTVYKLLMKLPDVHNAVLAQMTAQNPEIVQNCIVLQEIYPNEAHQISPPKTNGADICQHVSHHHINSISS